MDSSHFSPLAAEVAIKSDIPFLEERRKEKLDVYLPPRSFAHPRPALVFIHGGGWYEGSKNEEIPRQICTTLARYGFVVFCIDYALNSVGRNPDGNVTGVTRVVWPQNFFDCKSAVRFARKNATEYGVDPARLGVMGLSAGAHLALLVGATGDSVEWNRGGSHTEIPNDVAAVIEFYGRCEISFDRVETFKGSTPEETKANLSAASPVTHMTPAMPPVLAVQGGADPIVPVEYGRRLARHLGELGVAHEYIELSQEEHGFGLEPSQQNLIPSILSFLEIHMPGK